MSGPPKERGVLCLHGFTGTPFEVQAIADALAARGYDVSTPLLSGHGLDPLALEATHWKDWLASARAAFDELASRTTGRIAVVGFSMGGLLALELAKAAPDRVAALAILAAPLRLRRAQVGGIRLLGLIPPRLRRGRLRAIPKSFGSDVAHPDLRGKILGLPAMPLRALQSLLALMATARIDLKRIITPTFIAHGRQDHTVPIADSFELAESLGTAVIERLWLENSFHLIGVDVDKDLLIEGITRFFDTHARW
jgi:carboxylesterase